VAEKKEERKKVTRRRTKGKQQRNQEGVKSVSRLIRYFTLLLRTAVMWRHAVGTAGAYRRFWHGVTNRTTVILTPTAVTASYRGYSSAAVNKDVPPEMSFNVICLLQVLTEFVRNTAGVMNYKM